MSIWMLVWGGVMLVSGGVGMAVSSRHIRQEQINRRAHRMIRRLAHSGALERWA